MAKKKKTKQKKRPQKKAQKRNSNIITPSSKLVLPMTPFEQRMTDHSLGSLPPRSHPDYDIIAAKVNKMAERDIAFQIKFKETMRRFPLWAFARMKSGSGFLMASSLRKFFVEYLDRIIDHGPHSLPTSFNVVESFLGFNSEFLAFDLRDEREHLLAADNYFEWYSGNNLPRDPRLLLDAMQDKVIYSYDMVSDAGGYKIKTPESTIVIAGVALIRHSNELSCFLVAGENPANPPDKEAKAMENSNYKPFPGKESLEPNPELTTGSRYLEAFPKYACVHMLTRFDLSAGKHDVRYINLDLGRSYNVLTDDVSLWDDLHPDARENVKAKSLKALSRYTSLFSALASLIYLPIAFIDESELTSDATFKTEFYTRQDEETARQVINEFEEPVYLHERTIKRLARAPRSPHAIKTISPPELDFKRDGYWLPLAPGVVGKDKNENPIVGRTWVSRLDSWSAQNPSNFLLERPSVPINGKDPGIVYIMRSSSHALEVYKVGLTRQPTEKRAKDLSKTSAPLPFGILAQWEVGDCRRIEQEVHKRLDAYRVNPKREFFHCKLSQIVATIEAVIAEQ